MKNTDHIRVSRDMRTLSCERCLEEYEMNLPAPIDIVAGIYKAWKKIHKSCKKKTI